MEPLTCFDEEGVAVPRLPARRGYYVYVTEACNLRCSYCFVKDKRNNRHLTRQMAERILRFITEEGADLKSMYVHFFGGEPLIQAPMVEYMASELRAWSKNRPLTLRLGITTNGTLLTTEVCEMLCSYGVGVQLSLDGSKPGNDVHRRLMGSTQSGQGGAGAYDRVQIDNYITHFGKQRPNCRMTLTPENLQYLAHSIRDLHARGFLSFSVIPDSDAGDWTSAALRVYECEISKVFEYWAQHRDISVNLIEQTIRKLIGKAARSHLCCAGDTVLGITIDGDIYPCHDFAGRYSLDPAHRRQLILGNIETGYVSTVRSFADLVVDARVKSANGFDCPTCWAKWVCGRGCPYMNYARSGDIRRVNAIYCSMTRINSSLALQWMSVLDDYRLVDLKASRFDARRRSRHASAAGAILENRRMTVVSDNDGL